MNPNKNPSSKELIKHSAIIALSGKNTHLEKRLYNHLIAHAFKQMQDQESFSIELSTLTKQLSFNSNNTHYLKSALKWLVTTAIEFNLLGKEKEECWEISTLLSWAKLEWGTLTYSFSPFMRSKYANPSMYAKLNLYILNQFRSKYSLILFEVCSDFKGVWTTPIISLQNFRKLMGLSENQYATFKSLNQKVIKEAIGEINSLSELRLKATFFKTNRSVSSLQFTITIEPNSKTMIQDKPMIKCELHHTLTEGFELSEKQAHYIINSYPKPYIYESLDIIKRKRREGTVKNLAAYTYQTIKNDYTPPTTKPKLSRGVQPTSKSAQQDQEDQQV